MKPSVVPHLYIAPGAGFWLCLWLQSPDSVLRSQFRRAVTQHTSYLRMGRIVTLQHEAADAMAYEFWGEDKDNVEEVARLVAGSLGLSLEIRNA